MGAEILGWPLVLRSDGFVALYELRGERYIDSSHSCQYTLLLVCSVGWQHAWGLLEVEHS